MLFFGSGLMDQNCMYVFPFIRVRYWNAAPQPTPAESFLSTGQYDLLGLYIILFLQCLAIDCRRNLSWNVCFGKPYLTCLRWMLLLNNISLVKEKISFLAFVAFKRHFSAPLCSLQCLLQFVPSFFKMISHSPRKYLGRKWFRPFLNTCTESRVLCSK